MPGGRPSKVDKIPKDQMAKLYHAGFTDKQVCDFFGIDESTLTKYKARNEKFFMSLKEWKEEHDRSVERSLLERARGYSCPDTKAQWVNDNNGGHWEYAELTKHYPPDPTSMIFWLKNRQPEKWRESQNIDLNLKTVDIIKKAFDGE